MNALSRREEETLLKTTKARALTECDPIVKGMSALFWLRILTKVLMCPTSVRIRRLRNRTHIVCRVGLQGQVQGFAGMYATIVSLLHCTLPFQRTEGIFSTSQSAMEGVRKEYLRLRDQEKASQAPLS